MRISISVTNFSWPGRLAEELSAVVRAADDAGLAAVWVSDHLIQADPTAAPGLTEMLEAYTVLGYLAAQTRHVELGTMVSAVTYRPSALLIKAITTLDVLSGGRAWLGIGAGYAEVEARAMGLPLPPVGERFEVLEDTLKLAAQMWSGDDTPFTGKHFALEQPHCSPMPVRRPRVLIGGTGRRKTLRLVAQYADACNLFDIPDGGQTVRRNLDVLAGHCTDVGRDFDEIEKTLGTRLEPGESSASFLRRCETAAAMGIDHMMVITPGYWTPMAVATVAEVVPAVRGLG
jgi:F420-dependent oxidoreductase-like protein